MAQRVNIQERLKMRFLTVDYKEKQEAYGTSAQAADTGSIALEILNIPESVLEDLLELTEPMMQLVDFLNKNKNPDSSTLAMMLTASRNVFRVVDLLRDVPPFSSQDFTWLDGKLPGIFSADAVKKAYRQRKKEMGEVFIPALCLVAQLGFGMREECWTIDSLDIYKGIRRMAAIYNATGGDATKAIEKYCKETGCQPKTAVDYLDQAIDIRARQTEVIADWDENDTEIIEDILPSRVGDLCYALWNRRKIKAVRESLRKLSWRDQMILKARNAICNNCGGMQPMKEQYSFREISNLIGSSTDKGAEKAYHTALGRFTAQLAEDNVIRVVDMVRIEPERVKKKNAVATYRYQADCDGAWGEVHFDFEKKRIRIKRLAEWDTTKSHIYAWKVICVIALSGELPEKKRIVFERE